MARLVRLPGTDTFVQPSLVESIATDAVVGQVRITMASGEILVTLGAVERIASLLRGRQSPRVKKARRS